MTKFSWLIALAVIIAGAKWTIEQAHASVNAGMVCEGISSSNEVCEATPNTNPSLYLYEWSGTGLTIPATCYDRAVCVVTCSPGGTLEVKVTELSSGDFDTASKPVDCS